MKPSEATIRHRLLRRLWAMSSQFFEGRYRDENDRLRSAFRLLYLTPRAGCLPDSMVGDDLEADIRRMFRCVALAVGHTLEEVHADRLSQPDPDRPPFPIRIRDIVETSFEDRTHFLLYIHGYVLLEASYKAWGFYFDSLQALCDELWGLYSIAERRLLRVPPRLLRMGEGPSSDVVASELAPEEPICQPCLAATVGQRKRKFGSLVGRVKRFFDEGEHTTPEDAERWRPERVLDVLGDIATSAVFGWDWSDDKWFAFEVAREAIRWFAGRDDSI